MSLPVRLPVARPHASLSPPPFLATSAPHASLGSQSPRAWQPPAKPPLPYTPPQQLYARARSPSGGGGGGGRALAQQPAQRFSAGGQGVSPARHETLSPALSLDASRGGQQQPQHAAQDVWREPLAPPLAAATLFASRGFSSGSWTLDSGDLSASSAELPSGAPDLPRPLASPPPPAQPSPPPAWRAQQPPLALQPLQVGGERAENEVHTPRLICEIAFAELHVQQLIGEGAFGRVFRALWRGSPVAVKVRARGEVYEAALAPS